MDATPAFPPLRSHDGGVFRMLWRSEPGGLRPDMHAVVSDEAPVTTPAQRGSQVKLHVRGISKTYGAATVLKPLELKVFAGELLAVLGPSGSGKTTLLQIICGLVERAAD
jgi:putative spermidine/putrescine transport system ATP-binding protein